MYTNTDFKDLLKMLNEYSVKYLLVGGYAVMYYAEPRFTKDIDIWIEPTHSNARNLWLALEEFGAPLREISLDDFCNKDLIYQIGVAPNRIDIMMDVPGVEFGMAWEKRIKGSYDDIPVFIINLEDLIIAKEKAGREQDLLDLKHLKAVKNRK